MTRNVYFDIDQVDDLALGSALVGCGGGGASRYAAAQLKEILRDDNRIRLLNVSMLRDSDVVCAVGTMGSPAVARERLADGSELARSVTAMARHTGRKITAVTSFECGGDNGLLPLICAGQLNLPCLDADLAGRAVSRLDQFSLTAEGFPITPMLLILANGATMTIDGGEAHQVEELARAAITSGGGWAAVCFPPLDAGEVRAYALPGTLSRSIDLGSALAQALESRTVGAGVAESDIAVIAHGRIQDVTRHDSVGLSSNTTIFLKDVRTDAVIRIEAGDEYLIVLNDGEVIATVPDLICLVDIRTGQPIETVDARSGTDVALCRMPAHPWWLSSAKRLDFCSPRSYGIDLDPILMRTS
ncbi:DUF917 domain-containing protein [Streptomyces capillispiralis]|nr:DUF917 domain-containing protein [Streptomyces capillispiralis]